MTHDLATARRFSVAPMMDWTDRHCRYLHRLLTSRALLFTEMVTSAAVVHGPRERLLGFDPAEQPVALQLGGSDPAELAEATRIATAFGYAEINLNVGCPSDRVQSGRFGACLMAEPALVADCVRAMRDATDKPVTVKCRIGIDDQDTEESLDRFAGAMVEAGVAALYVHARKAWLKGLSPKENREIPPLDHDLVLRMKGMFGGLHISINGGITDLDQALAFLDAGLDGVMVGRAAYHQPADILCKADRLIWGQGQDSDPVDVVTKMGDYIADHIAQGGRLHQVTRHMLGLFAGTPGARQWRRILSEGASRDGADFALVRQALDAVLEARAQAVA